MIKRFKIFGINVEIKIVHKSLEDIILFKNISKWASRISNEYMNSQKNIICENITITITSKKNLQKEIPKKAVKISNKFLPEEFIFKDKKISIISENFYMITQNHKKYKNISIEYTSDNEEYLHRFMQYFTRLFVNFSIENGYLPIAGVLIEKKSKTILLTGRESNNIKLIESLKENDFEIKTISLLLMNEKGIYPFPIPLRYNTRLKINSKIPDEMKKIKPNIQILHLEKWQSAESIMKHMPNKIFIKQLISTARILTGQEIDNYESYKSISHKYYELFKNYLIKQIYVSKDLHDASKIAEYLDTASKE